MQLDPDTWMSPGTLEAALRAVGGVCAAVDAGGGRRCAGTPLSACRPPGHHAERETAMGFCLFGNVAIAAKRALDHHGLSRVAIVDFDVHHGNGTQDLLWDEARVLFVSSHQMPLYPGTGEPSETRRAWAGGERAAARRVPAGREMRAAYEREVFPALRAFQPELVLISAGFDAHADDPLAELNWAEDDYRLADRSGCATWPTPMPAGGWSRSLRAAMIWTRWRPRWRRMCGVLRSGAMTDKPIAEMSFEEAMAGAGDRWWAQLERGDVRAGAVDRAL